MEKQIDVNGRKIFINTMGSGEALLFLHSSLLTSEMWNNQIEYFSKNYLVIAYDFCGHGKSDLPTGSYSEFDDLKAIIDKLNLSKIHLVACSYGGSVAIDFTLKYPQYISKLILISPAINGYRYPLRLTLESINNFRNVQKHGIEKAAELFIKNNYWAYFVPEKDREKFKNLYIKNENFYKGNYRKKYILKPAAIKRLNQITVDTLLITGNHDSNFNKDAAAILRKQIKTIHYCEIEKCGHLPNIEKSEEVNNMLEDFLKGNATV